MRTSSAAWAAALAVMSMHGPFTTAEAAPARQNVPEAERHKYLFPRQAKAQRPAANNTETIASPPAESPAKASPKPIPGDAPVEQPAAAQQPSTGNEETVVQPTPAASSSRNAWVPSFDASAWLASMMGAGQLAGTADGVVTSTLLTTYQNGATPVTGTYTVTWTETAQSSSSAAPITTSSSVVVAEVPSEKATTEVVPSPSAYTPDEESIVQPTPSSSSVAVEPTTETMPAPSAYTPPQESIVQPTPSSSSVPIPSSSSEVVWTSSEVVSSSSGIASSSSVVVSSSSVVVSSSSILVSSSSAPVSETATLPSPSAYTPSKESVVQPTPSSSSEDSTTTSETAVPPSAYQPDEESIVQPTPSSSVAAAPVPTTSSSVSSYVPPVVVQPTPSSSTIVESPVSPPKDSPSAYSPPVIVQPTPSSSTDKTTTVESANSPSAYQPTSVVQPTPKPKPHQPARPHGGSSDYLPETIVQPTRQSADKPTTDQPIEKPTTQETTEDETTTLVEPTTRPTPSSYHIISSRSDSSPIFPSLTAPWVSNTTLSLAPTAFSSSSSVAVSSSSVAETPVPSSDVVPTSVIQPTISRSEKTSSSGAEHSPSRHHPGRPHAGTSEGMPESPVKPTRRPTTSADAPSSTASSGDSPISVGLPTPDRSEHSTPKQSGTAGSGGISIPVVLPTSHSSDRTTRDHTGYTSDHTRQTGDHTGEGRPEHTGQGRPDHSGRPVHTGDHTREDQPEHTRQSSAKPEGTGVLPSLGQLTSGLGLPDSEPTPTRRSSTAKSSSEASSSTGAIIVGLSTIIESTLPVSTPESSASQQGSGRPEENPLASLGLTGRPTATAVGESPSGTGSSDETTDGDSHGRPGYNPWTSLGLTGVPTSLGSVVLPTGTIPDDLPTGTSANDSNHGRPQHSPQRPVESKSLSDLIPGVTAPSGVLPSGVLPSSVVPSGVLPTDLPVVSSANDTTALLPLPTPSDDSSAGSASSSDESRTSEAGLPIVVPTPEVSSLPVEAPSVIQSLSGGISSILSEATSDLGSVLTTDTALAPKPTKVDTTATAGVIESMKSSLSEQLTSIVATATDPSVSPSLESELSSAISSAESSLQSEVSEVAGIPTTNATPETTADSVGTAAPTAGSDNTVPSYTLSTTVGSEGTTAFPVPVTLPSSAANETPETTTPEEVGTAVPAPGSVTPSASYSLSTTVGSDGTTAIPVPVPSPSDSESASEQPSEPADTPSDTYQPVPQPSASAGSTIATSVPLTTGATVPVASSGTAPSAEEPAPSASASSIIASTAIASSGSSESTSELPVVAPTPSESYGQETPAQTSPATTPATTAQPAEETPKETSIEATGTDSATEYTLPSSWHFDPTVTATPSPSTSGTFTIAPSETGAEPTGIPTYMPRLIQPPGGMPDAPENSTLVQFGLNYGLNFPFVVRQQDAASQIFAYLPQGVAYGLGISSKHVRMNALMPYDTSEKMQFITTLAQAWVPKHLVGQLELDLHTPMSGLYTNPNEMINTLMNMINPTIPILPGASMDGSASQSADNPGATGGPPASDAAPIGGDSSSSMPVRGSSVGIGIGAVCGAAAYAAAMVYVARRYKKKRQGHQRASSVPSAGEMSQTPGAMSGIFMSGANGNSPSPVAGSGGRGSRASGNSSNGRSVREQGISAPVMSENSLGWN